MVRSRRCSSSHVLIAALWMIAGCIALLHSTLEFNIFSQGGDLPPPPARTMGHPGGQPMSQSDYSRMQSQNENGYTYDQSAWAKEDWLSNPLAASLSALGYAGAKLSGAAAVGGLTAAALAVGQSKLKQRPQAFNGGNFGNTQQGGAESMYGSASWSPNRSVVNGGGNVGKTYQTYDTPATRILQGATPPYSPNRTQGNEMNQGGGFMSNPFETNSMGNFFENMMPRNSEPEFSGSWGKDEANIDRSAVNAGGYTSEPMFSSLNGMMEGMSAWTPNRPSGYTNLAKLQMGQLYESQDYNGNWWPVIVESRNGDGSYVCSVLPHQSAGGSGILQGIANAFDQQAVWPKVWAMNCREPSAEGMGLTKPMSGAGQKPGYNEVFQSLPQDGFQGMASG